jgi:hypothetical protein
MFNFIKKLFGEGKIRAEIECDDGSKGVVKIPYIGDLDTLDMVEFKDHVQRRCLVDYGKRVTKINITGMY